MTVNKNQNFNYVHHPLLFNWLCSLKINRRIFCELISFVSVLSLPVMSFWNEPFLDREQLSQLDTF